MTATRIASGSTSTGVLSGWLDVTASPYNAVGDGTTDDSAAIQSAINTAKANGGVVYFPVGKTFAIATTLNCSDNAHPFSLLGGGSGSAWSQTNIGASTLKYTAATGSLLQCHSTLSIEIAGLRLVYSNASYTGAGTNLVDFDWSGLAADCQLNSIHHCAFNSTFAVDASHGARSMLRLNKFIIGTVHHNHFGGCQDAIFAGDTGYVVGVTISGNTYNFAQSSFVRIGTGDCESLTINDENVFEGCPTNGAIYNDATGQTYSCKVENNWYGDSGGTNIVGWINGLSAIANNFTGIISGNRFASNPHALKLVGDWLVMGNTFETGTAYRTSTYSLTDIANFYNMSGSAVFESGHGPNKYVMLGSHTTSGAMVDANAHISSGIHVGSQGAAYGVNATEIADSNAQVWLGVQGTNGGGVIASANRGMVYTDFNTSYNGPGILRLQAPGIQTTNEVQLIAGTTAPAPLVRASSAKLAFYNVAPVVQPATTGTTTGFTAGAGTGVKDDSTFTGGIGSTAYRLSDVVLALKQLGLMTL